MGKPRVTWLLPVRNAEQHLESTLISIAEQDYPADAHTVLVWDDGSTDGTPALLDKWIGKELPGWVVGRERIGASRALARLVVSAGSELVARIDAGCAADPGRLEQQVAHLSENRRVGVIGSQLSDQTGNKPSITSHPSADAELRWSLRFINPVSHPTVMLRRSAVLEAGNYREIDRGLEDYDLWVRMSLIVRFATIHTPLTTRRVMDRSAMTSTHDQYAQRFHDTRDAMIDRLLPGTDAAAARRLLNLAGAGDDRAVNAEDLLRFRHAAMLAARACRYDPTFFISTDLFKRQEQALRERKLQSTPLIRPVLPLIKRANRFLHRNDSTQGSDYAAA